MAKSKSQNNEKKENTEAGKKGKSKRGSARKSVRLSKTEEPKPVKAGKPTPPPPPQPLNSNTKDGLNNNKSTENVPVPHQPNQYPGLLECPQTMAVAGSECGTYDSICKLLRAGLKFSERVLILTPWGNYAVFRYCWEESKAFYLFDGCTCNANRFRYWDLNSGTAGLLYFSNLHDTLCYIMESREIHQRWRKIPKVPIEEICS